jgi:hypothetical protein
MKADPRGGSDSGEVGLQVQQQSQVGPLTQVGWRSAAGQQEANLDDEIDGEAGLVER